MSSSAAAGKSALSGAAPAGTNWLPPPPPPSPSPRLPRNWTLSATISTASRFAPSCASHSRQSSRPSIADGAALREVLRAALGLVAEDGDAEVVGLVDPLARLVLAPAVHGDAEAADGRAARRVPQLGVARQVADEHDAVDVRHGSSYSSSGTVVASGSSARRTSAARGLRLRPARASGSGSGSARGSGARAARLGHGHRRGRRRVVARRARARALDVLRRHVAHHGVVDLEHARRSRRASRRSALEHDEVVDALALLRDLVREAPPAPGVVAAPRAAGLLDELARRARSISSWRCLGELRVQHQQNLVRRHSPDDLLPSHGLSRPRLPAPLGTERRDDGAGSGGHCSIAVDASPVRLAGGGGRRSAPRPRRSAAAAPQPAPASPAAPAAPDPRAEELRAKLAETQRSEPRRRPDRAGARAAAGRPAGAAPPRPRARPLGAGRDPAQRRRPG